MKILNFGSLNIDYVYHVDHFVAAGETLASTSMAMFCGGKGLNQSIAAARAGAVVYHAGKIGSGGEMLEEKLKNDGINIDYIMHDRGPSGHAIIQVDEKGENSILLFGGANEEIKWEEIDRVFENFGKGDLLLLQNEINNIPYIMKQAKAREMFIAINPAPMNEKVLDYPLEIADFLVLNEIEGRSLADESNDEKAIVKLAKRYPQAVVVYTLGKNGVRCMKDGKLYDHGIYKVKTVDTTAAGDTFMGYFLTYMLEGQSVDQALCCGAKAAAICVTRKGASDSIPMRAEVEAFAGDCDVKGIAGC